MSRIQSIICPHCFETILPKDVVFETMDEGQPLAKNPKREELMARYRRNLSEERLLTRPLAAQENIEPNSLGRKNAAFVAGVVERVPGLGSVPNSRRLCPHCHFPIPPQVGLKETIMVGLAGRKHIGKTVYLCALLHEIAREFAPPQAVNAPCEVIDRENNVLTAGGRSSTLAWMYDGVPCGPQGELRRILPYNTARQYVEPVVVALNFGGTSRLLVLFDIAGEVLGDAGAMSRIGRHFGRADAILYLYHDDVTYDDLHNLLDHIRTREQRERPCYFAFVRTRADELLADESLPKDMRDELRRNVFDTYRLQMHSEGCDLLAVAAMDDYTRQTSPGLDARINDIQRFLCGPDNKSPAYLPHLRRTMARLGRPTLASFPFVRCFTVSSLGEGADVREMPICELPGHEGSRPHRDRLPARSFDYRLPGDEPAREAPAPDWPADEEGGQNTVNYMRKQPHSVHMATPIAWLMYTLGVLGARREAPGGRS